MASSTPTSPTSPTTSRRRGTSVSSVTQSVVSVAERVLDTDVPRGFIAATAQVTSSVPTIAEIRRGSVGQQDSTRQEAAVGRNRSWSKRSTRLSRTSRDFSDTVIVEHTALDTGLLPFPPLEEERTRISTQEQASSPPQGANKIGEKDVIETLSIHSNVPGTTANVRPLNRRVYTSGYIPPPKVPWTTASLNGLRAFGKWFITPFGFLVTIYGLNVVAWGGMLFLLLCGAAPAMCHVQVDGIWIKDCNNIDCPRRIWIEIDSQILNALFCVTGFGLVPWRFRDLYYLMRYRLASERKHGLEKKMFWLRKLAGHYRTWFRLPGSQTLDQLLPDEYLRSIGKPGNADMEANSDIRLPLPLTKTPDAPISGVRAPPTSIWKVDWFVWCQVWNTFYQICLSAFMWGLNRYDRPSWSTGLFVALACGVAGAGGWMSFKEGRLVKKVEGLVPSIAAQEAVGMRKEGMDVDLNLQQTRTGEDSIQKVEESIKQSAAV